MKNDYSITVIIPNYNKEKYIGKCLDSILRQTLLPDEIIVVDDCSTDNSVSVIEDYENRFKIVKGIYLKRNGGVSNARNIGLEAATSEYVTFTDSDDIYYSHQKLENEMQLIKKHSDKDIVAYSAFLKIDEYDTVINYPSLKPRDFSQGWILLDLLSRNKSTNIPRDYCVKKEVLKDVGAYSFYKDFYEDLDLLIRLSRQVQFYSTCEHGIAYRMTAGGLSKRNQEEHISTVNEIINNYKKNLNSLDKVRVKVRNIMWRTQKKLSSH